MHYEKERTSVSPVTTLGFKLWPDSETELPGRRSLTGRASAGIVTIKVTVFGHSWGIHGLSATGKKALTQEWSLSAIRVGLFLTELKALFPWSESYACQCFPVDSCMYIPFNALLPLSVERL